MLTVASDATAGWIHGGMVAATVADSAVCSLGDGVTFNFLACADLGATITRITFAAYGDPSQCPHPKTGLCTHPDSQTIVEKACLGQTNCTVSEDAFKDAAPTCMASVYDKTLRVKAVCSGAPSRRANNLRFPFVLPAAPIAASAVVSALGYQALYCNGHRVSQHILEPGRQSNKRVFFSVFDLTPYLTKGPNVIAVELGNGWSAAQGNQPGATQQPPSLFLNGSAKLEGGRAFPLHSGVGNGWSSNAGSRLYDSVYVGETRNFTHPLSLPHWRAFGYNDSDWVPVVATGTPKQLTLQTRPAVVELAVLPALWVRSANRTTPLTPGTGNRTAPLTPGTGNSFLVDFGQNIAGAVRLRTPTAAADGQVIVVRHCEVLNHPPLSAEPALGACWLGNPGLNSNQNGELAHATSVDTYVLSSNGTWNGEWLQPEFTVHGFRFAEISGLSSLAPSDVMAVVVGANITQSSSLRLSNPLIEKIQNATVWSQRGNTQDIFSDCPQRDERLGWMGDAAISTEEAMYNFGAGGIVGTHAQFLQMISDGQTDGGDVSDVVPSFATIPWATPSDPNWGAAFPTITHGIYETTGDTTIIIEHLDGLVRYISALEAGVAKTGLSKMFAMFGDWFPPNCLARGANCTASKPLCSAAAFITGCRQLATMALAVGNMTIAKRFSDLERKLSTEFNTAWLSDDGSSYATGKQTELAIPLYLGIVPKEHFGKVLASLIRSIEAAGFHVTTGILGTRALYEVLATHGRIDVALRLLNNAAYPSYGYMVSNQYEPSTTLWERWESDAIPHDQADASRNHIMYGHISAFFWKYLAGLRPALPGWQRAVVAPMAERCQGGGGGWSEGDVGVLDSVNARLGTASGEIRVDWKLHPRVVVAGGGGGATEGSRAFSLNVTAPVAAAVVVPCVPAAGVVTVGGAVAWRDGRFITAGRDQAFVGVTAARRLESGGVEFSVTAGHYAFLRK
jgi:alpha-L-rhamnosidase